MKEQSKNVLVYQRFVGQKETIRTKTTFNEDIVSWMEFGKYVKDWRKIGKKNGYEYTELINGSGWLSLKWEDVKEFVLFGEEDKIESLIGIFNNKK